MVNHLDYDAILMPFNSINMSEFDPKSGSHTAGISVELDTCLIFDNIPIAQESLGGGGM